LQKSESEKKRFCAPILLEISETFTLGIKQDKNTYKEELKDIYARYGISTTVTQKTITEYFEASPDNSVKPSTYTLLKFVGVVGKGIQRDIFTF
ncbi:hypothetical protein, partial [Sunxiuqinia dokdonensis]|uniref:hypothetical protein n=1 Tax=Sunxiuqinia dokdonensis TaxID=1409788 RepID=UPI001955957D